MSVKLTNSQEKCYLNITKKVENFVPRPNYIITGDIGVGKTTLGKYVCEHLNGRYTSFVEEFGYDFIDLVDYRDIDSGDLLIYISKNITSKFSEDVVVIDGIEFILNKLLEQGKIEKLINLYFRMSYNRNVFIIIPKLYIPTFYTYSDNIIYVDWNDEDKNILSEMKNIPKAISSSYLNGYQFN